ncbi:hypothetical protein C8J56DRAFT_897318 [Mycena floridula]|nr:hypothetical protein C8J56DRAFT_897318 [Mycena floridula]
MNIQHQGPGLTQGFWLSNLAFCLSTDEYGNPIIDPKSRDDPYWNSGTEKYHKGITRLLTHGKHKITLSLSNFLYQVGLRTVPWTGKNGYKSPRPRLSAGFQKSQMGRDLSKNGRLTGDGCHKMNTDFFLRLCCTQMLNQGHLGHTMQGSLVDRNDQDDSETIMEAIKKCGATAFFDHLHSGNHTVEKFEKFSTGRVRVPYDEAVQPSIDADGA